MTEELVVDPSILEAAAAKLGELVYPAPLSPLAVPAADPVSAAINETLPVIESPVITALPAIKAASTRTGSSLAIAAGIYADTDQRLAEHVSQGKVPTLDDTTRFSASQASASEYPGAGAARLTSATVSESDPGAGEEDLPVEELPSTPEPDPAPAPAAPLPGLGLTVAPLGKIISVAGAVGPASQNVQAVTSAIQGALQSATTGAGANGVTTAADQAQLTDATQSEDSSAASGEQAQDSVPLPPSGNPATNGQGPSGLEV